MTAASLDPRVIGLAGGIDKDGGRAEELLAVGFGSIEFGTVTARPEPGGNPGVGVLVDRLAALGAPSRLGKAAIGIGIGLPAGSAPEELTGHWRAGLDGAWQVADYVSFNLSARANRHLLAVDCQPHLAAAFAALVAIRDRLAGAAGRRVALAVKFPLGADGLPLPPVAELAAAAGFDRVTVVRSDGEAGFDRLARLAGALAGGPAVIAVGGIRCAGDVRQALAAGASGVQVHRVFSENGAACLAALLGD